MTSSNFKMRRSITQQSGKLYNPAVPVNLFSQHPMMVGLQAPHVVNTTLNYYLSPARGGAKIYQPGAVSDKRRPHDAQNVQIVDVRGRENDFELDKQGFQIIQLKTSIQDVEKDADWRGQYFEDIMAQVKRM